MEYFYRVFDLTVRAPLFCPELLGIEPIDTPDVVIRYGEVPEVLEHPADSGARWQSAPGEFLLNLKRVARFWVRNGSEILIQPVEGVEEESIRTFLLSGCLAILLHQKKLFALHASGVQTEHGAILFTGSSGAGKSTLVTAFLQRGYKMIADDMTALYLDANGRVMVLPGFPPVKLWTDSAEALGRSTQGMRRVLKDLEKFASQEAKNYSSSPLPLRGIYILSQHQSPELKLEAIPQTLRFNALLDNTWQKLTLPGLGLREWHFQTAARIASLAHIVRVTRPIAPFMLNEMFDLIVGDFESQAKSG